MIVQCISTIAMVKSESEVLDCPVWIMLINVVALEMLKAKLPHSLGKVSLSHKDSSHNLSDYSRPTQRPAAFLSQSPSLVRWRSLLLIARRVLGLLRKGFEKLKVSHCLVGLSVLNQRIPGGTRAGTGGTRSTSLPNTGQSGGRLEALRDLQDTTGGDLTIQSARDTTRRTLTTTDWALECQSFPCPNRTKKAITTSRPPGEILV